MYFVRYLLLILVIVALGFPYSAFARPSASVSPLVITIDAEARDILTREITITNTGTQNLTIYPSVNNISMSEGGEIEEFITPSMSDRTSSLASWIEISRAGIDIPKGSSSTVTMTLRVNPFPVPGTYHAYLGFGWGGNRDIAEQIMKAGRAPGVVVTVNIVEDKNEFLKLSRFIIDRFITSKDNQAAVYTIKNPGDEVLAPKGDIIFYDKTGKEVAAVPVNPDGQTIEPGQEVEFETKVPVGGMFGKYKAFLSVEYGSAQLAAVQDTAFFYVFPLKVILGIMGVIILFVIIGAFYFHKKYLDEEEIDDSDALDFFVRDSHTADEHEHDIDLKKK